MHSQEKGTEVEELPDDWWNRVYAAVVAVTFAVLFLLWSFSRYFAG